MRCRTSRILLPVATLAFAGSLIACAEEGGGPVTALVGGSVIDGTGAPPRPGETVLIREGRILAIGRDVRVPADAEVVDVTGMTVLPGMVDMHGHMYAMGANQFAGYPLLFLAGGVTTVFSPGDFDPEGMIALRDRIASGEAIGPRILTAGPYFDREPSQVSWIEGVSSVAAAAAKLEAWKDRIDAVKVYSSLPEDMLAEVVRGAHAAGLRVTGHLGGPTTTARAVALGIDGLEHGIFAMSDFTDVPNTAPIADQYCALAEMDVQAPAVGALVDAIVDAGVWITPTIITLQAIHPDFDPPSGEWTSFLSDGLRQTMADMPAYIDARAAECLDRALAKQLEFVGRVHAQGGLVVAGTDPVTPALTPGYGLHAELANLVKAGFTPLEAIRAASWDAARALGLETEIGTIEAGKEADLVVVRGDPSTDIARIGNIIRVFVDGRALDPAALREQARGSIHLASEAVAASAGSPDEGTR
jgi:imidazolonepropionase-like amidohydrolase